MAIRTSPIHALALTLTVLSSAVVAGCGDKPSTATSSSSSGPSTSGAPGKASAPAAAAPARGAAGAFTLKAGPKTTDYPVEKAFVIDSSPSTKVVLLSGCPAATCKEASSFKSLEALCKDRKSVDIVVEKCPDEGPLPAGKVGKATNPKGWVRIKNLSANDPDLFFPEALEITSSDKAKLTGKLVGVLPAAPSTTYDFQETGVSLSGDFTAEVCPSE